MTAAADLKEIFTSILTSNWQWVALLSLILLAKAIFTSPIFKGWWGEQQVTRFGLRRLDPNLYTTFNDLYLPRPDGKGTTQIDHLVVSPYSLFVIETKNYQGWIFGSEKQKQWTQQIFKKKSRFQNPIHQNQLHINALSKFLDIEKKHFQNIVMFIGDCTLKTELPPYVITRGLCSYIKNTNTEILTKEQTATITAKLTKHTNDMDKKSIAKAHRAQFQ